MIFPYTNSIYSTFPWNIFAVAYKVFLNVAQKIKLLDIYYSEPVALSKFENIFQIILDLWFMVMPA